MKSVTSPLLFMQNYALDQKGDLICALQAKKEILYLCPECGSSLKLRGGHQRRLHFYHLGNEQPCRQNGKSETHLALQMHIQKIFGEEECLLEKPFFEINRIADCYVASKLQVFEIQCSMISEVEIRERTLDYERLGLEVIWILHEKTFNKKRVSGAEHFLKRRKHFFTDFDAQGRGMIYQQSSLVKGGLRAAFGCKERVDLKGITQTKQYFWRRFLKLNWRKQPHSMMKKGATRNTFYKKLHGDGFPRF